MDEILQILFKSLEKNLLSNTKKNQNEDLLTNILLTKTNKKNLLNIFEESSIFKYKLIEKRENIELLRNLEDQNLITKITRNNFDKYFINLNGLYFYQSRNNFSLINFIEKKNEELFPLKSTNIKIHDEERVFIILLILLGATSSDTALQSNDKYENDLLFEFTMNIYNSLLENNLYSFDTNNFTINWSNKKNKNFESFKTNVDSTTKYGIIKIEKNIRLGTKWYLDPESEYLISALLHKSNNKLDVYNETQIFIQMLKTLKRDVDSNYYFKELPKLNESILERINNYMNI